MNDFIYVSLEVCMALEFTDGIKFVLTEQIRIKGRVLQGLILFIIVLYGHSRLFFMDALMLSQRVRVLILPKILYRMSLFDTPSRCHGPYPELSSRHAARVASTSRG